MRGARRTIGEGGEAARESRGGGGEWKEEEERGGECACKRLTVLSLMLWDFAILLQVGLLRLIYCGGIPKWTDTTPLLLLLLLAFHSVSKSTHPPTLIMGSSLGLCCHLSWLHTKDTRMLFHLVVL